MIFTEHRDTLSYLEDKITTLLGRKDEVVMIHGGLGREERMHAQESFRHDPEVKVLLATDAAGEGIKSKSRRRFPRVPQTTSCERLPRTAGR